MAVYILHVRASDTPDLATLRAFRLPSPALSVWAKTNGGNITKPKG
jgi:hypothetical protein